MSIVANPNPPGATFEFDALREARNYRKALLREFAPYLKGDVLEVGAGIGQFTQMIAQLPTVKSITAVEPDDQFITEFRKALPETRLVHGLVDSLPVDDDFDGIVSVNVMEHIEADQREMQQYAARLKERKGALCIFVPAGPEIYAPLDHDFGHYRRYRKAELRQKLEDAGFHVEKLRHFNLVGYFGWWLNFCVLKKRKFDVGAVKLFDRAIFPVGYFLESHLMSPPFGQSLIAICRAR